MYFQSKILKVIGSSILYGFIIEQTIFFIPQFTAITYWIIRYGCFYYIAILDWSLHTHYTLKRESLVGTLEAPRGVRQMNGVPQSGADQSTTAESRVRTYWSNRFTVTKGQANRRKMIQSSALRLRLCHFKISTDSLALRLSLNAY